MISTIYIAFDITYLIKPLINKLKQIITMVTFSGDFENNTIIMSLKLILLITFTIKLLVCLPVTIITHALVCSHHVLTNAI